LADVIVSQDSVVATCARCGGIFNIHLTANSPRNLPGNFFNRLRFDRIIVMSLWPRFLGPPCMGLPDRPIVNIDVWFFRCLAGFSFLGFVVADWLAN